MKIFITGGCGYVGYSLVKNLSQCDFVDSITIYDNLSRPSINFFFGQPNEGLANIRFIKGDLLDGYKIGRSLRGHDVVIHLAAKVSTPFSESNIHEFDQVNNWGTAVLSSEVERTPSVAHLIYLSSVSVYGNSNGIELNVDSAVAPQSAYGQSKLKGEKHIMRLANRLNVSVLRSANVFGFNPSIRLDSVVNRFMFDANYLGRIEVHGTGNQKRAFIYIQSLAEFIIYEIVKDGSGVRNLAQFNLSINDLVDEVKALYPATSIFRLDQHLSMRSVAVQIDKNKSEGEEFTRLLLSFKEHFKYNL